MLTQPRCQSISNNINWRRYDFHGYDSLASNQFNHIIIVRPKFSSNDVLVPISASKKPVRCNLFNGNQQCTSIEITNRYYQPMFFVPVIKWLYLVRITVFCYQLHHKNSQWACKTHIITPRLLIFLDQLYI
jgi:hypothetical protein